MRCIHFKLIILLFFLFHSGLSGQIDIKQDTSVLGWKKGGFINVNMNQVALSNWAAGGESALSTSGLTNLFIKYRKNGNYFEAVLDAGYGLITTSTQKIRKNEDKLEINAKYGHKARGDFFYAAMLNFRSQFAPGYNFPNDTTIISNFLAPGYLSIALGMDYKPKSGFNIFFSPVSGRITIVNDQKLADAGQFGVERAIYDQNGKLIRSGKNTRTEIGTYLRARIQRDLMKNIKLISNLQLFNNYTDPNKSNRKNIDVNWETLLLIKANKWLTTNIFANLIYDQDVEVPVKRIINNKEVISRGPRTQFKEALGIGLSFMF